MTLPPVLSEAARVALLAPRSGRKRVVIDTDAFNEIDDQFAVSYGWLSPHLDVEAVYAAPFHNDRSSGPGDGMIKSLEELHRLFELLEAPKEVLFQGATDWLDPDQVRTSPSVEDLVRRARTATPEDPLYVIALAAPTNVASALLTAPDIGDRVVVVWMGAHPTTWYEAADFNASQDIAATNVLLDGTAPLVHLPGFNVTEHLRTSLWELDAHLQGSGPLGRYLLSIYRDHRHDHVGRTKEIWDLGPVAWLVDDSWAPSTLLPSPRVTACGAWWRHPGRPLLREVYRLDRDAIFMDLFTLLNSGTGA